MKKTQIKSMPRILDPCYAKGGYCAVAYALGRNG